MHDYDDVPNILSVFGDSVCDFSDFGIESNLPAVSNEDVAALLGSSTSDQSATNDELSLLLSPHTVSNILPISFDEQQNLQQNFEYSNEESEKVKSDVLSKRVEKEQEQEQEVIPKKNQKALSLNNSNKLNNLNISDNLDNTNNKKTGLNEKRNGTQQNKRKRRKKIKVISVKKKIVCNNKETTITQRFPLNGSKDPQEMTKEIKQKMKLKKQRNRINARKCRQRKKQYIENLESKTKILQIENSKLSGQVLKLNQKTVNLQQEIENLKLALKRSNEKIIQQNQTKLNKENDNEKEPKNGKAKSKKIFQFITNLTTIPSFHSDLVIKNEKRKEEQEVCHQQYQSQQQQQQHTNMMGEQLFNSTNLNKKYKATFFVILLTFGLFFTNPNFIDALAEICVGSWKKTFSPQSQIETFFSFFLNSFSKKAAYELDEELVELKYQLSFQIRDQLKVNKDHKHSHQYLADNEKTKFNNHLLVSNSNSNSNSNTNTNTNPNSNTNKNPNKNTNSDMGTESFYCDDQSMKSKISESILSSSVKNKRFSS
ncbi:transcription factor ap-1 [Anaeramoeba flamelloides]|uniref:Transcription factor ap-1 n=1 Tax=Anaeramoeba flamelloides TaxID=1746091 RepID=A0ABQ8XGB1_9EUKA|nr:transcription factor ap-1 [Anaeramoeba flamelloides]